MRRAGGWILAGLVVAAMAGGGWVVLRPRYARETLEVGYLQAAGGRGPSNDAMFSGAAFALQEAGGKAGRFKVNFRASQPTDSKLPPVWIGTSEAHLETGDFQPARLRIATMATLPRNVDGQRCILAGFARQGAAAGSWVRASGTRSVLLLRDAASPRGCSIADGFVRSMAFVRMEALDSFEDPGKRATLISRILANPPGILFYSGEDAPYGTSEALFSELRAKGYAGTLVMGEADPEVSFLALPCRVPEGTYLVSPIGPPSPAFASAYEPATGRHAGPHAWVGYLAMKATLEVLEQATTGTAEELQAIARRLPPLRPSCSLYVVKGGTFVFVQDLK